MQLRIKICGITNVADALMAAEAGADAVGLNFYEQSPRFIDPAAALKIVEALPADVAIVGVFVNHRADEIGRLVESIKLDYAQLHGDQNSAQIGELPRDLRFIRAHRCVADDLASLADFLRRCRDMGRLPAAVLLDADAGAAFGGSGRLADWTMIQRGRPTLAGLPMILAGGLTPDNVAAAIQTVRPHAVDVASGVESSPGKKDPAKVRDFVAAAREAFARLE